MTLQDDLRAGPARPRRRCRWDLVAAWVVIVGPALGIAVWLGLRQRVGDLEERLIRDANATFSRPIARPVHVEVPAAGTFGEAVARHLPPIQRWADSVKDDAKAREGARDVAAGKRPFASTPPSHLAALGALSLDLDALLAGTRAGRLELPLAPRTWTPCEGADWTGYRAVALLAGLRARRALAEGDAGAAMATCLDGLAWGRDAAVSSALVGHLVGVAVVKRLWPACADALARLPRGERASAAAGLRAVRDGFPSIAEMYRADFLSVEIVAFGRVLSADARARLVPLAEAQIPRESTAAWERWMARDGWRSMRAAFDGLLRVAALNRGLARDAGFAAVTLETERRVNPLAFIAMPAGHAKYARRAEAAEARLDLLVAAAAAAGFREREGRWPASVGELAAAGLLAPAEAERLAQASASAEGPDGPLALAVTVYTGDEKEPTEALSLGVRPPARGRLAASR